MRYSGDPYWIDARYSGVCARERCHTRIKKGDKAFYFPRSKTVYCEEHGLDEDAYYQQSSFDESVITGNW